MNTRLSSAAAATAAALLLVLAPAPAASAHSGDAPVGSNYRTEITAVAPDLPGVTVQVIEAGARLQLTNHGEQVVEVLGYDGEPYLRVRPGGVWENAHSPATYRNQTLGGDTAVPESADPDRRPRWRPVADSPVARWHDRRARWVGDQPPPAVAADPDRRHLVAEWAVPLRTEVGTAEITGTLAWLPPPPAAPWWVMTLLGAAAVGTLGLLRPGRRWGSRGVPLARSRDWAVTGGLALVAAGAGAVALAYAVASEIDAGASNLGQLLGGLVLGSGWAVLSALAAIAAGGYLLARRPVPGGGGDFALALAGACLAIFAGVAQAAVFGRSVAPVPVDALWARVAVGVVLAGGVGVAAAGTLRLRRATRPAPGHDGS